MDEYLEYIQINLKALSKAETIKVANKHRFFNGMCQVFSLFFGEDSEDNEIDALAKDMVEYCNKVIKKNIGEYDPIQINIMNLFKEFWGILDKDSNDFQAKKGALMEEFRKINNERILRINGHAGGTD